VAFGYGFEFSFAVASGFAENDFFAYGDFSAGAHKSFPGIWRELADEQDFDRRLQMSVAGRVVDARRLGVDSDTATKQASG
jgi:hypothetical protein